MLLVAAWGMLFVAVELVAGYISPVFPTRVFREDKLAALMCALTPVLLLFALFGARRGVERGYAAETGILPGLLLFGVLMFVGGSISRFAPHAPGLGLLLLAAFATARADPPAPRGARLVWVGLAGIFGAWCVRVEPGVSGSVSALILYVGWSACRGTGNNPLVPTARRLIGMLLFVALMGLLNAVQTGVEFMIVPLSMAVGLILLDACSPAPACRAGGPPAA